MRPEPPPAYKMPNSDVPPLLDAETVAIRRRSAKRMAIVLAVAVLLLYVVGFFIKRSG